MGCVRGKSCFCCVIKFVKKLQKMACIRQLGTSIIIIYKYVHVLLHRSKTGCYRRSHSSICPYGFDIFAIAVVWTGLPETGPEMIITRLGKAKNRGMIIKATRKTEFINDKRACSSLFPKSSLICFILTQRDITFLKLTGPDNTV